MKLKHLQSLLQNVESFSNPKIKLEQYCTSAHIAANILHRIFVDFDEDFQSLSVADLGSGPGVFAIGASALEASHVLGVEVDSEAINDAINNIEDVFEEGEHCIELLQMDVCNDLLFERFENQFDIVVTNPPFGTKKNAGIDMRFLERALQMSSNAVYSLHKSSTREFIEKKSQRMGINMTVLNELRFDLPATYKCHKVASQDVAVDLIKFAFV